jgi:hypothetical protein
MARNIEIKWAVTRYKYKSNPFFVRYLMKLLCAHRELKFGVEENKTLEAPMEEASQLIKNLDFPIN